MQDSQIIFRRRPDRFPETGFTLIEVIVVMVILGLVGVLGADIISSGFRGFDATDNRTALYEEGKIALVRMEREIHNAIPNAVNRISATDLMIGLIDENAMLPIFGRYSLNPAPPPTTLTDSYALPPISDSTAVLPTGTLISIYNRDWNDFTSMTAADRRIYTIAGVSAGVMTILAPKTITPGINSSPRQRYFAVDRAVRFTTNATGDTLLRSQFIITSEGDDINTNLLAAPQYPLAKNILPGSFQFAYTPAALTRNAMITINFTMSRGGEKVVFHKEVHVRNVP